MLKTKIAVFVSGGGTNLQALLDAQAEGKLQDGQIVLVLSSNPGAYALQRAEKAGVSSVTVSRKDSASQAEFEAAISRELENAGIEMIVLAGFMSILSADFTARWEKRIINVLWRRHSHCDKKHSIKNLRIQKHGKIRLNQTF